MKPLDESIKDYESAVRFITWCIQEIGLGFHPDTPFSDYITLEAGKPLFDEPTAERLDHLLERTFEYCDPYHVGLGLFQKSMGQIDAPPVRA